MEIQNFNTKYEAIEKNVEKLVLLNTKPKRKNNNNQIPCATKTNPPGNGTTTTQKPKSQKGGGPHNQIHLENIQRPKRQEKCESK